MNSDEFHRLFTQLLRSDSLETEWIEFKHNNSKPELIGEYLSALSNSAGLLSREAGYIIWGIEDKTRKIIGTTFKPHQQKIGNQDLEPWLANHLTPRIEFSISDFEYEEQRLVVFKVQPCQHTPVRFKDTEFIRIGSYKKKLKDYPEKERTLWLQLSNTPFEKGKAKTNLSGAEVLRHIDYPAYFESMDQNLPDDKIGILNRLESEKVIIKNDSDSYDISNLGAILFAKNIKLLDTIERKALRIIMYNGKNRIETTKEHEEARGYAVSFESMVAYIDNLLPRNEQIGQALRREVRMYPEVAIRELVANVMIHQDFSIVGMGSMIEVFTDRIEFTNPGRPLIDPLRFVDEPPQSRNEALAKFMRRLKICEERGSGFDKVVFACELFQLPAPKVQVVDRATKVTLYAYKKLAEMDKNDKIHACYLHACLKYVSNEKMTNSSLRERFGIEKNNNATVSRIIADTLEAGLVKPSDPRSTSRKHASYIPFWV